MVEFMYSFESMLKITGDIKYADRIEDVAFNSLSASVATDFKGLHYLTAPNLVQCDTASQHNFSNKVTMLSFAPWRYRCCQHNVAQGWPYYAEHLWLATAGNGLAAVLYAPCEVTAKVADGQEITIIEDTDYPFKGQVDFTTTSSEPVKFPLTLRIPGWCDNPKIHINRQVQKIKANAGSYVTIEKTWNNQDKVTLELPMKITLSVWKKVANSVSVNRGPLTYSLKIGQEWKRCGGTDKWPAYEVFPTTPWNYGLIVDQDNPDSFFTVSIKEAIPFQPFKAENAPIELLAKGKRIPNWTIVNNCAGKLQASPIKSDEPVEDIVLIPMGCAHLRISSFPTIGEGPEAHNWERIF